MIENFAFSQVICVLLFVSEVIITSFSGSFRTISEKSFASSATIPFSWMVPSTMVSIPSSISLAVKWISAADALIRIVSRIGIVVFEDTAFDTILMLFCRSDFLQMIFINKYSFPEADLLMCFILLLKDPEADGDNPPWRFWDPNR